MKTCFQIDNEAEQIKSKYSKQTQKQWANPKTSDLFNYDEFSKNFEKGNSTKPTLKTKNLTKAEKLIFAGTLHEDEEKAEDALIALQLLHQYKKDPNFIQKEMKQQAKKREIIFGKEEEKEVKKGTNDPAIIQEERHRLINEKREQRKLNKELLKNEP